MYMTSMKRYKDWIAPVTIVAAFAAGFVAHIILQDYNEVITIETSALNQIYIAADCSGITYREQLAKIEDQQEKSSNDFSKQNWISALKMAVELRLDACSRVDAETHREVFE